MTLLFRSLILICFLSAASTISTVYSQATKSSKQTSVVTQDSSLIEEFSFQIKDFKLDRQSEHNILKLSVSLRYVTNIANDDYPDYRPMAKDVETFLKTYPIDHDYWEIVNKKLTLMLLQKYPALSRVSCEIEVQPVGESPYVRASRVTRERIDTKPTRK